jgi:type II secretory pathway pseudopilin PulG
MSYPRFNRNTRNRDPQKGAVFIVMLVILVLGVATVLVASLSSAGLTIARDVKTSEALAQAKEALIGKSASYNDYPGSFPCPDTDDDGEANPIGGPANECPHYIGRLPWKTLGIPDLHDAGGERLWYALSRNVRRYAPVRPLNSDKTGTLNVTGSYADNNLLAIVFAPGSPVGSQGRSTTSAACITTGTSIPANLCATNYLEGSNDDLNTGASPNANFQSANSAIQFNDQLATISHDQLFATVEKRIAREIKNVLHTYYAAWGAFPFAATFADPTVAANFKGSVGTYSGLIPVDDQTYIPTWSASPTSSYGGLSCVRKDGYDFGNARWRCGAAWDSPDFDSNVTIPAGVTFTITGYLNNVGRGLWRPHNINNVCEVRARDSGGNTVLASTLFAPNSVSITNTLDTNGRATIVFQATGKTGGSTLQRIELRDILSYKTDITNNNDKDLCPLTPATSPVAPTWLFDDATRFNNWHQVAYYSVAEEFAPGGDHTCSPLPCLTVNGQNGGSNVHAVIVTTGRDITGNRPTSTLTDYLEGQNSTPDTTFENKTRSTTFNDQVIIIAP